MNSAASHLATSRVLLHGRVLYLDLMKLSYTADQSVNIFNHFGEVLGNFWTNNPSPSIYPRKMPPKWQKICPPNERNVYSSFIHNIQILEKTQMSMTRRMASWTVVYSYNGTLLGNKKEWITVINNNMDESQTLSWLKETNHQKQMHTAYHMHECKSNLWR